VSIDDSTADYSHSVTRFIQRVKLEDPDAAGQIWQRYFQRLLPLARARLRSMPHQSIDEEDVLVSVFDRFFRAASQDRFANLQDRSDLWQILLMLTERKVADQYRRATAQKRLDQEVSGRRGRLESADTNIEQVADDEPGPDFIAAFNDRLARAITRLGDTTTREVAILRMEGYQNSEIADRLAVSLSTVERKLRLIRELWAAEFAESNC